MCGITGGFAKRDIAPLLLEGLKRLEYRGYDSAGMAIRSDHDGLKRLRMSGKVKQLADALEQQPLHGHSGIAHTRWATHGKPSERNAHPHMVGNIALVHNGIIENYQAIKEAMQARGIEFQSDTDTEVVAQLLHQEMNGQGDLKRAVMATVSQLKGAYAIAILSADVSKPLVVVRQGAPLVIGLGEGEHFVASDMLALLPITNRFVVLEEGDIAEIYLDYFIIYDLHGVEVKRPIKELKFDVQYSEKGDYRHFMQKEIFEQPRAVVDTLYGRLDEKSLRDDLFGAQAQKHFTDLSAIQIVACGTSYHAGLVAKYWIESVVGIPVRVDIASEMRYQPQTMPENSLFVTLSQSGETADTLAALRCVQDNKHYKARIGICNVPESSLVRESDFAFLTHAGPEIGVATTKGFLTQLISLLLLTLSIGKQRRHFDTSVIEDAVAWLRKAPNLIEQILSLDSKIQSLAEFFADKNHSLFLGRGLLYPIAQEGALKLKEISYIHAEAYPAGELKHGPLALVDKEMPVVALASNDHLIDKLRSNLEEVRARHGQLIVFSNADCGLETGAEGREIVLPACPALFAPILHAIPMQMLAYHVAVLKGTDVDQPRNLAKSVTVE